MNEGTSPLDRLREACRIRCDELKEEEVISEMEGSLKTDKEAIQFYTFFYEFNSTDHKRVDAERYKISNEKRVILLKNKNIQLFSAYYLGKSLEKQDVREIIREQVKYYGVASLFTDISLEFDLGIKWIMLANIYLRRFSLDELPELKRDVMYLVKRGLTLDHFKDFVPHDMAIRNIQNDKDSRAAR